MQLLTKEVESRVKHSARDFRTDATTRLDSKVEIALMWEILDYVAMSEEASENTLLHPDLRQSRIHRAEVLTHMSRSGTESVHRGSPGTRIASFESQVPQEQQTFPPLFENGVLRHGVPRNPPGLQSEDQPQTEEIWESNFDAGLLDFADARNLFANPQDILGNLPFDKEWSNYL